MAHFPLTSGGAVALLGGASTVLSYLARLTAHQTAVEFATGPSDRVSALVRQHRHTVIILGDDYSPTMRDRVALVELRNAGAVVLSTGLSRVGLSDVATDALFPTEDLAWFVPETYRTYPAMACARVQFSRSEIDSADPVYRAWLAQALMLCPRKMKDAARTRRPLDTLHHPARSARGAPGWSSPQSD